MRSVPNESFDDFFRRDFPRLVAFLCKAGYEPEHATDAAAEAMAHAYQCWSSLTAPSAWVRKAAFRFASNQAQRHRTGIARAIAAGWVAHSYEDVSQLAEVEEQPTVLALLGQLPPKQRLVMAWHLEGFGTAEIAEEMGIPAATVRSHLRHARDALKSRFVALTRHVEEPVRHDTTAEEVPNHGSAG